MNLQYRMILDYTARVERLHLGKHPTKLTVDVANYIQHHMSELITAEKIAEELFLSRPYLSRKFKEETGESLTDFILKEKTEEAKRLLRQSFFEGVQNLRRQHTQRISGKAPVTVSAQR